MSNKNLVLSISLLLIIVLGIGAAVLYFKPFQQSELNPTFTPIYCNDYEFTCCNEQTDSTYTDAWTNKQGDIFTCLVSADYCTVSYSNSNQVIALPTYPLGTYVDLYATNSIGNCQWKNDVLNPAGYYCPDAINLGHSVNGRINAGQSVYLKPVGGISTVSINTVTRKSRLDFCGRSGCITGVPVSGANKCTFITDKSIYGESGALIRNAQTSAISYTVPSTQCILAYQSGDRHICGNKEEQCTIDTDCNGHTFGNKECIGRNLQTYGCKKYNPTYTQSDLDLGFLQSKDLSYTASRCEIISAVTVQCCGDTDCGTNAFCDVSTFTCKASTGCVQNSDCGVSQVCDYTTKQLKTPKCTLGQCGYSTVSVSCCNDANCAQGYYCDTDRTCKENVVTKEVCPYACCAGEQRYFDKACATGKVCCNSGTSSQCMETCAPVNNNCPPWLEIGGKTIIPDIFCLISKWFSSTFSVLFLALGIALGIIVFFGLIIASRVLAKEFKQKQDAIFWIAVISISAAVSIFIAYITISFWWLSLIISIIIIGINIALKALL